MRRALWDSRVGRDLASEEPAGGHAAQPVRLNLLQVSLHGPVPVAKNAQVCMWRTGFTRASSWLCCPLARLTLLHQALSRPRGLLPLSALIHGKQPSLGTAAQHKVSTSHLACAATMLCCMQASQVHLRGEEAAQEGAAASGARGGRASAGAGAQVHAQAAQPAGEAPCCHAGRAIAASCTAMSVTKGLLGSRLS